MATTKKRSEARTEPIPGGSPREIAASAAKVAEFVVAESAKEALGAAATPSPAEEESAQKPAWNLSGKFPDGPAEEGVLVSATLGEILLTPMPYHSFRVGPFSAETRTLPGETRATAHARLMTELLRMQAAAIPLQAKTFAEAIRANEKIFAGIEVRR